jgi:hypothetical protein
VVFGGRKNSELVWDTWTWDGKVGECGEWTNVTPQRPADSPPGRSMAAAAFDRDRNGVVMFGGWRFEQPFADAWIWDGERWHEITPPPQKGPRGRWRHSLTYFADEHALALFGGQISKRVDGGNEVAELFDDLWLLRK